MTDIVNGATRSRMMSSVKNRGTGIELNVRRLLHGAGLRYRLNVRTLPGKPDIVLRRYSAVIFVHGCFWHGHTCPLYTVPSSRADFWLAKISANQARDERSRQRLLHAGWKVLTIWECAMRGKGHLPAGDLIDAILIWLHGNDFEANLQGKND